MNKLTLIKKCLSTKKFNKKLSKNLNDGIIVKFDENFLNQFNGMYYQGLPIYYHLYKDMTNGRCYDSAAVLALAFGGDCVVCTGELKSQKYNWENGLGHRWCEKDGYVYDTTWQIICKKKVYYKQFKPYNITSISGAKLIDNYRKISDFNIRNKKWYEENYSQANLLIFQVKQLAELHLKDKNIDEKTKIFYLKLLHDLPDETKAETTSLDINNIQLL